MWGNRHFSRCPTRPSVHPHVCGEISAIDARIVHASVHPHVCGEIVASRAHRQPGVGSPPRVWGNLGRADSCDRSRGSPPRVWGNCRPWSCEMLASGSPPRVWGNRDRTLSELPRPLGSPPRVWGNRRIWHTAALVARFTPTCVGKSDGSTCRRSAITVHPHVCGEIRADVEQCVLTSPVHPHVCGEICETPRNVERLGSPPRVWGNLPRIATRRCARDRFTPTCVGKSGCLRSDHARRDGSPPRVWGNCSCRCAWGLTCGSPPRVWGNLACCRLNCSASVHPHVCGEIPSAVGISWPPTVHPHVCGEISATPI